jgi:hypothetical protein
MAVLVGLITGLSVVVGLWFIVVLTVGEPEGAAKQVVNLICLVIGAFCALAANRFVRRRSLPN